MKGIDVIVEQAGARYQVAVVRVLGQIDTTTSHELERRLQYLLKDRQFEIVVDLSRVNYISSAGWGIFISEIRGIRESGGDLKLAGMTPEVAEVFELLEFHNILESYRTVEGAVEKFEAVRAEVQLHEPPKHESEPDGIVPADEEPLHGNEPAAEASHEHRQAVASQDSMRQRMSEESTITATAPRPTSSAGTAIELEEELRQKIEQEAQLEPVQSVSRMSTTDIAREGVTRAKTEARPVTGSLETTIIEIVKEHPEYGILRIRKELSRRGHTRQVNPLYVFLELKRLNLETKEKRKRYSQSSAALGEGE